MSGAHEVSKARLKYPNGDRFSSCHKPSLMTMIIVVIHVFATYLVDLTSFGHLASRATGRTEQLQQISATGSCLPALAPLPKRIMILGKL
jgi:hypothetical protein